MAFGATTQPTIFVMKPLGRASLGLVQGASKKQGSRTSVLRLPQEDSRIRIFGHREQMSRAPNYAGGRGAHLQGAWSLT